MVLDRPGRGPAVGWSSIVARRPRVVAYVACDPAALARDVAVFAEHGYDLAALRAFDLFPMTHHVECVALLRRPALTCSDCVSSCLLPEPQNLALRLTLSSGARFLALR